jgi:hypothetical protein
MARQLRIEYAACIRAAGRLLAPTFRLGDDQMNEEEWTKARFDFLENASNEFFLLRKDLDDGGVVVPCRRFCIRI